MGSQAGPRNLNVRSNSGAAQWRRDTHYRARRFGKYTLSLAAAGAAAPRGGRRNRRPLSDLQAIGADLVGVAKIAIRPERPSIGAHSSLRQFIKDVATKCPLSTNFFASSASKVHLVQGVSETQKSHCTTAGGESPAECKRGVRETY